MTRVRREVPRITVAKEDANASNGASATICQATPICIDMQSAGLRATGSCTLAFRAAGCALASLRRGFHAFVLDGCLAGLVAMGAYVFDRLGAGVELLVLGSLPSLDGLGRDIPIIVYAGISANRYSVKLLLLSPISRGTGAFASDESLGIFEVDKGFI